MVFDKIRKAFMEPRDVKDEEEYIEIDLGQEKKSRKVLVKLFVLRQYDDVTAVLNSMRDGYTIAIVDIRPMKKQDSIELKRAISKIKKTVEALEGNIAGFGENLVIATPSFAQIHREETERKK